MTDLTGFHVSFHDSTLVSLVQDHRRISLLMDDVSWNGKSGPAAVILHDVSQVTRNSTLAPSLLMEAEDAEVLTLRQDSTGVTFVVKWNSTKGDIYDIVTYELEGARLELLPQPS